MRDDPLDPSTVDAGEVALRLGADLAHGLTSRDAAQRLARDGRNELAPVPPVPRWRRVLAQLRDPLVYLLLVAVVISLVAWASEGAHAWPIDAIVIVAIIVVNAVLGYTQEARAESAVAALAKMTAVTSTVLRDGVLSRVPSATLVRGDVLVLAEGDAIGADARLVQASSLRALEASLTGESEAVNKEVEALAGTRAIADRRNMVWKGTAIVQGNGRAVITATGAETEVGAIAQMLEATAEEPTPLSKEVARLGRTLGIAVVIIAVVVVATALATADIRSISDVTTILLLGVSLAVAAVPEGLPAILSVVLALGVQRMAMRNAIVKKLSSVETLGSATVICSDKTGTLTRSEMTIERVMTASGAVRVTGIGYEPEGRLEHDAHALHEGPVLAESRVVLSGGSLAGNAQLRRTDDGLWEIQGDPTEAAFLVAERKLGSIERRERRFTRVREFPFTSLRKMMSTVEIDREHGDEPVLIAKGAPDVLLARCTRVREGMDVVPLDDRRRARILTDVDTLSDAALRTIAVAYRPLSPPEADAGDERLEHDLIFVGTVGIIDPPREEAAAAIRDAHRAGIRIIMITGDHPRTAIRIAADLGIVATGGKALTGIELDAMDDATFAAAVRSTSVYARVAPNHKLRIVQALQEDGNVVAMTGDGVNDAPALKKADIGIAMGITGTDVSREAADMVLADDDFATIVAAVEEGRGVYANIRRFLRFLLAGNLGEVITMFLGVLLAARLGLRGERGELLLPLLATQILWINLVTDGAPALALGLDPAERGLMRRGPRRRGEGVLTPRMWREIVTSGLVMAIGTLWLLDASLPGGFVAGTGTIEHARAMTFTTLVLAQLFNAFNARSPLRSAFSDLGSAHWTAAATAFSLVLQIAVLYLPPLQRAFGATGLSGADWFRCVAVASAVLWERELVKLVTRTRIARAASPRRDR